MPGVGVRGVGVTGGISLATRVNALFRAGEQGVWFEPSLTNGTCYQDSAGTTPVTAMEQPVGLILDKSKGLVLGSAVAQTFGVTGTNATNTASVLSSGFSLSQIDATSIVSGSFVTPNVAGKWYQVEFDLALTSGAFKINGAQFAQTVVFSTSGRHKVYLLATGAGGTSVTIYRNAAPGTASIGTFTNISIRELHGNHAYQSTSASRPVLSALVNMLTYTEQFDNAAWRNANATIDSVKVAAPNETLTGQKLIEGSAAGAAYISCLAPIVIGTAYTYSCYAKSDGSDRRLRLAYESGALTGGAVFDLQAGTVYSTEAGTASISAANGGWYLCTWEQTASSTNNGRVLVQVSNPQQSGTSGIYIWGADLRPTNAGVGLPPYQRVGAATDYDTTGFPAYLKFDGIDDSLVTNAIDFTSTDKMTVCAGVRKLSDAALGTLLCELSATRADNNGAFTAFAPGGFAPNQGYYFSSKGTLDASNGIDSGYPSPISNVFTGIGDIGGDKAILRINGTQTAASTANQGTGTYGNYPLYIGRRGGTANPYNGHIYSLIVRGAQSSDAQIASVERYVNGKTKAYA